MPFWVSGVHCETLTSRAPLVDVEDVFADGVLIAGYGFFDSGEVEKLGRKKKSPFSDIGEKGSQEPGNCFAN